MGSCTSLLQRTDYEQKEQERISREIDRSLAVPRTTQLEQTVLLLGPGDSGKSTVLKQMRMMGGAFTKEEVAQRKLFIIGNIYNFTLALRDYAAENVLDFHKLDREICDALVKELEAMVAMGSPMNPKLGAKLNMFWNMKAIQTAYEQRDSFHLPGSAKYFFENMDRISQTNYEPTAQDVVHIRMPTQGVVQVNIVLKNIKLRICDCGGQRSERRKWHHFFDGTNAVLFVAAVSEFDQVLVENGTTNRMNEAINLFHVVFNGKYFAKAAIILFLNKIDIFDEKIKTVKIKDHFKNYHGDNSYDDGLAYFHQLFRHAIHKDSRSRIYPHSTCAISDTVQLIISSVIDTVVQENLKDTGMI